MESTRKSGEFMSPLLKKKNKWGLRSALLHFSRSNTQKARYLLEIPRTTHYTPWKAENNVPPLFFNRYMYLRGWSGDAMVLGKLPVPRRPTNLDYSRARVYCIYSRCGWGVVWTFFLSSIIFSLPLSGRRPDID